MNFKSMCQPQQHLMSATGGYFEGKQQSKIWLVTLDDLHKMYELHLKVLKCFYGVMVSVMRELKLVSALNVV